VPQHHLSTPQKSCPNLHDNYRPIALTNNLLKLWTALIEDAGSECAESHGILSEQEDGFRLLRNIHDALLASMIMMMDDAELYNEDSFRMYADFKGDINAVDYRIMFKHMRQLGMPSAFVDTCEQLYGTTGSPLPTTTPHSVPLDLSMLAEAPDRKTHSPFMFTLFIEQFLRCQSLRCHEEEEKICMLANPCYIWV
jgi:hypothetical protein